MKHLCKLFILSVLLFSSCSKKSIVSKSETLIIYKDSISIKETVRLDTIKIPGDTLQTTFTIECDTITNKPRPAVFKAKSKRSDIVLQLENNGKINVQVTCDEYVHIITVKDKLIEYYKQQLTLQKESKATEVVRIHIPKWVWWLLATNIAYLLYRVRKPIFKLIKTFII